MDYLQYREKAADCFINSDVLNLIINGLPSILTEISKCITESVIKF